jgi:hypothetical protein
MRSKATRPRRREHSQRYQALYRNADGAGNTATGYQAPYSSIIFPGAYNTATGFWALYFNNSGYNNTAVGSGAPFQSRNGNNNAALGADAGSNIISASNVTCLGAGLRGENLDNTTWIANDYSAVTISGTTLPVHRVRQRPAWHGGIFGAIQERHRRDGERQ